MEEIVFPVPNICEFLTTESKLRVYYTTERDEQGSKINDFFLRAEDLFNEMNWQKKLRGKNPVFECTGMIGFGTSHPDIDSRKQWFRPEEISSFPQLLHLYCSCSECSHCSSKGFLKASFQAHLLHVALVLSRDS